MFIPGDNPCENLKTENIITTYGQFHQPHVKNAFSLTKWRRI